MRHLPREVHLPLEPLDRPFIVRDPETIVLSATRS